ncbi:hypothetical protein EYF80_013768 [Liparis tanakae]|uniref:Uncharacterized protein n=1 Tax=Liparis tanakae TaxID=230148 RepID=A0A4Z2IEJ7_9TELE|nr:hypothetical protein EYF80_013768 [Liparis tanakae]
MVVVFAKTRHEGEVFIIRTVECPRKEEIDKPVLFEGVAEVMQVLGNKRRCLHRGRLDDALEHDPIAEVLKDSRADEFRAVLASVALPDEKHAEGAILSQVGGHDAHHVHVVLDARHLLGHVGQVQEGADPSVAAAADDERPVGRMDQQKLVEVGHGLRVLAGGGGRRTGAGVLFGARLVLSLPLERRPQLVDGVDRPQI